MSLILSYALPFVKRLITVCCMSTSCSVSAFRPMAPSARLVSRVIGLTQLLDVYILSPRANTLPSWRKSWSYSSWVCGPLCLSSEFISLFSSFSRLSRRFSRHSRYKLFAPLNAETRPATSATTSTPEILGRDSQGVVLVVGGSHG